MNASDRQARRHTLRRAVHGGALLLVGQEDTPRNYAANAYPFRQDSSFLYFVGVDQPGLAALELLLTFGSQVAREAFQQGD